MLVLAVVGIASHADATTIVTVPPGLSPGDTYRLVFVTSTTRDATSANIADYNTFVTDAANANPALSALGATWTAIASTSATDAKDNIGGSFSERIYRLDGTLVAVGSAGLFSGSILNPILITEVGTPVAVPPLGDPFNFPVWTATLPTGQLVPGGGLGASDYPFYGSSIETDQDWISFSKGNPATTPLPLYAISDTLTAPVPEPGTIGLTTLGAALLFLARRRKQRNRRAT